VRVRIRRNPTPLPAKCPHRTNLLPWLPTSFMNSPYYFAKQKV